MMNAIRQSSNLYLVVASAAIQSKFPYILLINGKDSYINEFCSHMIRLKLQCMIKSLQEQGASVTPTGNNPLKQVILPLRYCGIQTER